MDELSHAIANGDIDLINRLFDEGADFNGISTVNGEYHLINLVKLRSNIIYRIIEDPSINLNITSRNDGKNLLCIAIFQNNNDIIKALIRRGIDINSRDNDVTALHIAAFLENFEIVRLLLEYGADKYIEDGDGYTPEFVATHREGKDMKS